MTNVFDAKRILFVLLFLFGLAAVSTPAHAFDADKIINSCDRYLQYDDLAGWGDCMDKGMEQLQRELKASSVPGAACALACLNDFERATEQCANALGSHPTEAQAIKGLQCIKSATVAFEFKIKGCGIKLN